MKSWTVFELNKVVKALQPLVGLRLQEVQTSEQDVVLGFYSTEGLLWLWIDLNAVRPCLLPWSHLPLRPQLSKTPLALFLRAHFVNRILREIKSVSGEGRVVHLSFGEDCNLEVRLFPHARNLLAEANHKSIAWQKPQPLAVSHEADTDNSGRDLETLRQEWLELRGQNRARQKRAPDAKTRVTGDIDKRRKALLKVEEELKRKQELPWKAIGNWLKNHQSLNVPHEWEPFVDKRRKLSWNIEQCFAKAREGESKIYGTEKRREVLRQEIAHLESKLAGPLPEASPAPVKPLPTLGDIQAQGRTLRLPNDLTVVAGKSAVDNLKILRKARAWDLWFHLKDYPSSHAVLFRNKNAKVDDAVLHEVGAWFVRNHLGSKATQQIGEKFAIVVTECRHVRPIKGDKIGRVTFHEERVFNVKL